MAMGDAANSGERRVRLKGRSAGAEVSSPGHNRVMVDTEPVTTKRRGRPPASDSVGTRRAIFDSARRLFAERGYGEVTNKEVASAAGITTGALYHYVESKLDLYVEVYSDLQDRVYGRFNEAVEASDTFLGKLEGILEAANAMNEEDYTLALLVGTVRTDMRRFPEIRNRLAHSVRRRDRFFVDIVDVGVATGEIAPEYRDSFAELIRILLIGLTEGGTESVEQHRRAINGIKALLHGRLIVSVD
jgi:AcrR family transcriptional regulator